MPKYDRKRKREYYLANREKRLAYQNEYYRKTKNRNSRKMEILEVLEPDEYKDVKTNVSNYNKEYYRKNKARIMAKRNARKAAHTE